MDSPTQHATPFGTPTPGRQKRGWSDEADASGDEDILPSPPKRLFVEPESSMSASGDEDDASEDDSFEYDASETGDEDDGSEYDASDTGDEDDGSEYDASETGFVPVRNPAEALPEALSALWTKLFSTDNIAYLHVLFGEGASYLEEYVRRFTAEYFYDGRILCLQSALRDANNFLTTINVMVRRIRGDGLQTKITFHFHPLNKTHCHNLLALRRVVMAILAYLTPLEARQRAEEEALLLEQEAIQLEEKAKELRQRAVQLRRH
jgi:hypothetical protein